VSGKVVIIGNIYRPPNSQLHEFLQYFEDILTDFYTTYDTILCFGDFNINLFNFNSPSTENLNSIMEIFNLKQLINEPTRVTDNTASLIDLIFYNGENIADSGTRDVKVSDHLLIYVNLNLANQ
jgi:hypothetical protein